MDRRNTLSMRISSVFGEQSEGPASAGIGPGGKDLDLPKPAYKSEPSTDRPAMEKMIPPLESESDAFLDDWDMTIHRCQYCQLPFGTPQRLQKHQNQWPDGVCRTTDWLRRRRKIVISRKYDDVEVQNLVRGGDLIVIAAEGDAVARYEVSSQILCAASPYFQASFGPDSQFISAQRVRRAAMRGQPRAEIELDDDPEAMGIVLKVLCFRHHEVPDVLSLPKIRKLAIIADKYELEAVLRPWVSKWSEVSKLNILLSGHEDWLFISWVFGYEGIFKDCTRALTRRDAAALGKVCNRMPHVVLEELEKLQQSRAIKLRDHFKLLQVKRKPGHTTSYCLCPSQKETCDLLHFGRLCKVISTLRLDEDETWKGNFKALVERITALKPINLHDPTVCYTHDFQKIQKINRLAKQSYARCGKCWQPSHSDCGWLKELQKVATACAEEDLHLDLLDFPSRTAHVQNLSPLDSVS